MCANTSKHRAERARKGTTASAGIWAAKQILEVTPSSGPRHAVKVTASYARHIGRVGALAVSLGVGMAVATTPGVAHAAPDADSAASPSGDPDQGTSSSASGPSGSQESANTPPPATTVDDETPQTSDSSVTSPNAGGTNVPEMNVNSSGGAHTSTYGTGAGNADELTPTVTSSDASAQSASQAEGQGDPADSAPTDEVPAVIEDLTPGSAVEPVVETPEEPEPAAVPQVNEPPTSEGNNNPPSAEATELSSGPDQAGADPVPSQNADVLTLSVEADDSQPVSTAAETMAFSAFVAPPLPPDPISALLAVPGTVVSFFSSFVGAILTPFLGLSPAAPVQLPSLWAVLAWVRREITHTFFNQSPIANPMQLTGQSLTGVVTGVLNARDPNGDPLTATVTQQGQYGTVVINANGTYTYTPSSAVPAGGIIDSFQVTISDGPDAHLPGIFGLAQGVFECISRFIGIAQRDTIIKTVAVSVDGSAIGIPPVVVTTVVGPVVTSGGSPLALNPSVLVADLDSANLSAATVKIGVGFKPGDALAYTPIAGNPITGSYDSTTGVLTLAGTATVEQYQDALRAVTFATTSTELVGVKAVSIAVTDTQGLSSAPGLVVVSMVGLMTSVPSVVVTTPVRLYTGGGVPVTLDTAITVIDIDSDEVSGATVTVGVGYVSGLDTLAYNGSGAIQGSWDAATGTLTLTGAGTVAEYQAALREVTFASTAAVGVKTVSIVVTADGVASLPGVVAVTVASLPIPTSVPSVVVTTPVRLYTGGGSPVTLDTAITLIDIDSDEVSGATVTIGSAGYDVLTDSLAYSASGPITGSWNAVTGTLTLTGTGTLAQYQAALREVTFASTAAVGVKTVSIVVTADGVESLPGVVAVTVAALPVSTNIPSVVATSPVKLYTAGGTAVVLDPLVTVIDVDSAAPSKATVAIGFGYVSGSDTLAYTGSGAIQGSWDAVTGTLTLTGAGTVADYQAALREVTFASGDLAGVKTVSVVVTADGVESLPGVVAVTVASLPIPTSVPSVVATSPVKLYTAGGTAVVLDPLVTVIDIDSSAVSKATVAIGSAGYNVLTDSLAYTGSGAIQGSWDAATGTLTLTGAGTVADYQAALRQVTFASTAGVGIKTVSVVVTADGVESLPGVVAVTVAALPVSTNVPSVVATSPVKLYTAGGTAVVLDPLVTVIDIDSSAVSGATVTVTTGYTSGSDSLAYSGSGPISGSFDAATGTLTLTGAGTLAQYQAALREVTFASGDLAGVKTVSVVVTADGVESLPGVVAVTVAALPVSTNIPSVVATSPVKLYTAGGTAVVLDPLVTVIDIDSSAVSGATVAIGSAGYNVLTDSLAYTGSGAIQGSWDAVTGTLTLTGAGTVADYQAALREVTFASGDLAGVKTVSVVVTADGVESLPGVVAVTVAALPVSTNVPSVVATSPVKLYTGGGSPVTLDTAITVIDIDSSAVSGATVTVTTGYTSGSDTLAYSGSGPITGSFDAATGTLTLTGAGTLAQYQEALREVTFASTATAGVKTVSVVVTADGVESLPGVVAVTVASLPVSTNVPSVVATSPVRLYTAGGTAVVLDTAITVIDIDSTTPSGATVAITTGYTSGSDTLGYTGSGTISGSWDAVTGTLTLTGAGTVADYQAALRQVTFASTAGVGVKTVSVVVTADGVESLPGVVAVTVAALPVSTNIPSVVATSPVKLYTAGGTAVVLDPLVTVIDIDSTAVSGATVTVTTGYTSGSDMLGYTGSGTISGSWDAVTGTLTLTGAGTVADYQAALREVTFASGDLAGVKTVSVVVTADGVESLPGVVAVTVASLPTPTSAPSVVATSPVKLYIAGDAASTLDPAVTIIDVDSIAVSGATVTVTTGYTSGSDTLAYSGSGPITGSWNAATGTLTLTGVGTVAQYEQALRTVTFATTSGALVGVRTVSIVVTADGVESLPGVVAVTVAALPVPASLPPLVGTSGVKLYYAGGAASTLDPAMTVIDIDSDEVSKATVSIGLGYDIATDTLAYTGSGPITASWDSLNGVLTLSGTATVAQYQEALRAVTFTATSGALLGVRTVSVVVTDAELTESLPGVVAVTVTSLPLNVPPLVTTSLARTYTAGATAITLDPSVLLADVNSATMSGATVTIGLGRNATDALGYTQPSGSPITGVFDAATGVLTLTGTGTVAQYEQALRAVTFSSGAAAPQGIRTVSIVVTDAEAAPSLPGTVSVTVFANQAPLVVGSLLNAIPYTAGNDPVFLDRFVVVADDSTQIKGAVVRITSGRQTGDVLAFTPGSGITSSYDAATGTLTLTGTATVEQYQQALRSVTFATASTTLLGLRTFTFEVTDQQNLTGTSLPFTATVLGNAVPLLSLSPSSLSVSVLGSGLPRVLDPQLTIADDSTKMSSATVVITGGLSVLAVDSLTVDLPNGSPITAQWDQGSRTLTLSGVATAAEYQAALQTATWDLNGLLSLGTRTFTFTVKDQQGAAGASSSLTVTLVSIL